MSYILLILAAFCCTLAAFFSPRPAPVAWYGYVHLGWLGMAMYLWSIVLGAHH
jgi:hypothetical protein